MADGASADCISRVEWDAVCVPSAGSVSHNWAHRARVEGSDFCFTPIFAMSYLTELQAKREIYWVPATRASYKSNVDMEKR